MRQLQLFGILLDLMAVRKMASQEVLHPRYMIEEVDRE
jgi:hypothetical protein